MQACPNCGYQLKDDYGMQTCPGCANVVLVDFDGNVKMADEVADAVAPIIPDTQAELADESNFEPAPEMNFGFSTQPQERAEEVSSPDLFDMPREDSKPPVQDFGPPGDPLSLNDFANSEASQARDGLYLYQVRFSGIDSKETRETLKEGLDDPRLGWDVTEIMSHIEKGELVFDRLSPVKASVVVQRCKSLPIDIAWEQILVTDIEGQTE